MLKPFRKLVQYTSSSKGAKITLIGWIAVVVILSLLAPSSKDYEGNSTEGSIKGDTPSKVAEDISKEEFPTDDGLTALLVFHGEAEITDDNRSDIATFSEW